MEIYEDRLGHWIKHLDRSITQLFNEILRPYDVGRSQWYVLYHLKHEGDMTQAALQGRLRVESPILTDIVNSLVRKGWVARVEGSQRERRAV